MKLLLLSTTRLFVLLSSLSTTIPLLLVQADNSNHQEEDDGKGQRRLLEKTTVLEVSDQDVDQFKARNALKESFQPEYQRVVFDQVASIDGKTPSKSIVMDDEVISLTDDLKPCDGLFTKGATYVLDGVTMTELPQGPYCRGDVLIAISKDDESGNEKLMWVNNMKTGTSLLPIDDQRTTFVTVRPTDVDEDMLKQFKLDADGIAADDADADGGSTRNLRSIIKATAHKGKNNKMVDNTGKHRSLQEACPSYKFIEVAIAYEPLFCSHFGGETNANNAVMSIVAGVNSLYMQEDPALCLQVVMSNLDANCNSNTYDDVLDVDSVCGGGTTLLSKFRNFWSTNRQSVVRDTAHFFHGKDFPSSSTIGCAYVGSLCWSTSSGVNEITFSNNLVLQQVLFAHELGHNCGANHDNENGNVMRPSICQCTTFTGDSVDEMLDYISTRSCITSCQTDADCDNGNPCITGQCDVATGSCTYENEPEGTICADEDKCKIDPQCFDGQCQYDYETCDNVDLCMVGQCNPSDGLCSFSPLSCEDQNSCTLDECNDGVCTNTYDDSLDCSTFDRLEAERDYMVSGEFSNLPPKAKKIFDKCAPEVDKLLEGDEYFDNAGELGKKGEKVVKGIGEKVVKLVAKARDEVIKVGQTNALLDGLLDDLLAMVRDVTVDEIATAEAVNGNHKDLPKAEAEFAKGENLALEEAKRAKFYAKAWQLAHKIVVD